MERVTILALGKWKFDNVPNNRCDAPPNAGMPSVRMPLHGYGMAWCKSLLDLCFLGAVFCGPTGFLTELEKFYYFYTCSVVRSVVPDICLCLEFVVYLLPQLSFCCNLGWGSLFHGLYSEFELHSYPPAFDEAMAIYSLWCHDVPSSWRVPEFSKPFVKVFPFFLLCTCCKLFLLSQGCWDVEIKILLSYLWGQVLQGKCFLLNFGQEGTLFSRHQAHGDCACPEHLFPSIRVRWNWSLLKYLYNGSYCCLCKVGADNASFLQDVLVGKLVICLQVLTPIQSANFIVQSYPWGPGKTILVSLPTVALYCQPHSVWLRHSRFCGYLKQKFA